MGRTRFRAVAELGLLLVLLVAAGAGCKRRPALDQQARDLMNRLEQAAEAGDLDQLRELLSPRFTGPDDLARGPALLLLRARLRERPVHILSRVLSLEVMPGEKRVAAEVLTALAAVPMSGPDQLANLEADVLRWRLDLVVEDGDLVVGSARWEPARPFDFQ